MTHQPQGQLRRVSVAVALNQGKKALTQADLAKIDALVKGAVGYDATRGDMVAINQRPFVQVEDAAPAFYDQPWFLPLIKQRTLVVGGTDDPIVPPANAMILAGLIPHSTLALVPGGHLEIVTSASDLGSRITTFLSAGRPAAA